jgi:hypothetical protein
MVGVIGLKPLDGWEPLQDFCSMGRRPEPKSRLQIFGDSRRRRHGKPVRLEAFDMEADGLPQLSLDVLDSSPGRYAPGKSGT